MVMVFFPFTIRVVASPGFSLSSLTDQVPSAPAVAVFDCPPMLTVTASPASARPHTGTALSDWSTR